MELAEIITAIKGIDAAQFAEAMQKDAQGHFQVMFRRGYGVAKSEYEAKLEEKVAEVTRLSDQVKAATEEATTLKARQPDIAKWQQEKEAALLAKEKEWQDKYTTLHQQTKAEKAKAVRDRIVAQLAEAHVDPFVAESLLLRGEISGRVQVGDDLSVKFFQRDGQTPLSVAADADPVRVFASSLIEEKVVPERYIQPPRNSGGPGSRFGGFSSSGPQTVTADDLAAGRVDIDKVASGEVRVVM